MSKLDLEPRKRIGLVAVAQGPGEGDDALIPHGIASGRPKPFQNRLSL
ncbi:MAG: hypothetical protein ABSB75_02545 [Candidatus Limnocylindrales bacterium]